MKKSGHRRLRIGRTSIAGCAYLITTVTRNRLPFFLDLRTARVVIRVMREADNRGDARTLAYVLMPDHLHWLMVLGENRSLSRVVQSVKASSARKVGTALWQRGFHDRAVRKENDLLHMARYVVANPLRKGLVDHVGGYSHWDAVWLKDTPE
ncbi:REP-associated tyrosine transposase [Methyloversatilis thermotolerans]|uniref:REP-associated tyrosine transposase n=1 Tax=Methyloversatilis thermotolerans TaxID=1346290 RepID=UPI000981CBBF|nr:transposase [Methyloversatilis thermotolerans]